MPFVMGYSKIVLLGIYSIFVKFVMAALNLDPV